MKGKFLITGVTALSVIAFFGCQQPQQQQPASTLPETKTSTATLEIMAPTEQTTSASLEIMAPTQEGAMAEMMGVYMKDGKMMTMMNDGSSAMMEASVMLMDGSKVMTDGQVVMKDGTTAMMKDGEGMLVTGGNVSAEAMMGMTVTPTKMDDKMMDKDATVEGGTMMEDNK